MLRFVWFEQSVAISSPLRSQLLVSFEEADPPPWHAAVLTMQCPQFSAMGLLRSSKDCIAITFILLFFVLCTCALQETSWDRP